MEVYITYDRYEHNEWFSVYSIRTDETRARERFKKDLFDFLTYGPDDCHSFQLQKITLTKEQHKRLRYLVKNESEENIELSKELHEMLEAIYEEGKYNAQTLCSTDGCSDIFEIVNYYCEDIGIEADDEDAVEEAKENFWDDEELRKKYTKKWIEENY